jgi:7-keto-8-aminopelargonate synthetase-like enzyme
LLCKVASKNRRTLVVTESLFSMGGDFSPLREIVELKNRFGAWLLVDEAHATGLYGRDGAGLVAVAGLSAQVDVLMGTMSKALGSVGGYIAGSRGLIDWLTNRARSFVYSTALPPGAIAASQAAVNLVQGQQGAQLRELLQANIVRFREQLPVRWQEANGSRSAIQPLICGESAAALQLSAALRQQGFLVPAIRAPSVPRKAARLRVTLSAAHRLVEIESLATALSLLAG